jgi:hypothetical protein
LVPPKGGKSSVHALVLVVTSLKIPPKFIHLNGSGTTVPSTGSTLCAFLRLLVANTNTRVVLPLAQVVVPVIT